MFKICKLQTLILWYEPNPRVLCAFGNVYKVGVSRVYLQRQDRCWCVSYSNLYHNKVISQISLIFCKSLLCTDKPDNCLCHNLVSKCNPPLARHCLDLFPDRPILNKQDFVPRFFTERTENNMEAFFSHHINFLQLICSHFDPKSSPILIRVIYNFAHI